MQEEQLQQQALQDKCHVHERSQMGIKNSTWVIKASQTQWSQHEALGGAVSEAGRLWLAGDPGRAGTAEQAPESEPPPPTSSVTSGRSHNSRCLSSSSMKQE